MIYCNLLLIPALHYFLFFQTTLPCSGGYHLERGGMSLEDAVGVNSKKLTTTENQGADVCQVYGLRGVCWMIVCELYALT